MFRTVPAHEPGRVRRQRPRLGLATRVRRALGDRFPRASGSSPAATRRFAASRSTSSAFATSAAARATRWTPTALPIGGNGLVIFNAELRVPVTGGLGVVGFVDTGNVFAHVDDIDLAEMRSAVGGGIRYKSPVGPLRVDSASRSIRSRARAGRHGSSASGRRSDDSTMLLIVACVIAAAATAIVRAETIDRVRRGRRRAGDHAERRDRSARARPANRRTARPILSARCCPG